jgi:hypothetical protein
MKTVIVAEAGKEGPRGGSTAAAEELALGQGRWINIRPEATRE